LKITRREGTILSQTVYHQADPWSKGSVKEAAMSKGTAMKKETKKPKKKR
jgi:hypothetical protein